MEEDDHLKLILFNESFRLSKSPNGYTIFIDEEVLTSSFKNCFYGDKNCSVPKQIIADALSDGVSPLKVELMKLLVMDKIGFKPYIQLQMSSISTDGNLFQKLMKRCTSIDQFAVYLNLEYFPPPVQADEGFIFTSRLESLKGVLSDSKSSTFIFGTYLSRFLNRQFSSWQESGSVQIEVSAYISKDVIYPSYVLSGAEEYPLFSFTNLLEEEAAGEIIISANNGVEFRCLKAVAYGNSPVLKAMFRSGMKESQTGRLEMTDISEEGVSAFIRYLNFRDLRAPNEDINVAFEVLYAAWKYDVPRLQAAVIRILFKKFGEVESSEVVVVHNHEGMSHEDAVSEVSRSEHESKEDVSDPGISLEMAFAIYAFVRDIPLAFLLRMRIARIFKSRWAEVQELSEYRELCRNRPEDASGLRNDLIIAFL